MLDSARAGAYAFLQWLPSRGCDEDCVFSLVWSLQRRLLCAHLEENDVEYTDLLLCAKVTWLGRG